ncbi:MAG TPA: SoxR reducing system RseC family protein [Woeseiaceae bacterium]|nr:SoxR reducing system RseC family protein [Woeseiaceae bacterium]
MNDPQGTVVAIVRDGRGVTAIVDIESDAVCARCASGRGCGAGLFAARGGSRRLEVEVSEGLELAEGDVVDIRLAPGNVLLAALIVYGLPLAGAAAAAALAYMASLGDAAAAAMALAGLVSGALIGRRRLRGDSCLARFTPTVSRCVAPHP